MLSKQNTSILSHNTTSNYRHVQFIFPVAVACFLLFGTAHFVLDNLRNNPYLLWQSQHPKESKRQRSPIEDSCNVFEGKWVWDNVSYPLYKDKSCPYLFMQVTCQTNGRPDSMYQNWRWQPNGCTLPRFNASKLLKILRNKRMMFVGDSVHRGMYESMICLVQSVIPDGKKSLQTIPPRKIFTIKEFNATIEFYWAPFIVESISDHATNHTVLKRMVKLDSIAKHSKQWEGVDILIFETYVWWIFQISWMNQPLINATYGSDKVREFNVTTAYRLALETWANWIESHINPEIQKVFFMTMSASHLESWEWKGGIDGNCFNESYPIEGPHWGTGSNLDIMKIVKDVLGKLKDHVRVLNITQMSEFRKDAHSSVYGEHGGKLLNKEQRFHPETYADCIHWCLPGVPDAWNEILYAMLLQDYRAR